MHPNPEGLGSAFVYTYKYLIGLTTTLLESFIAIVLFPRYPVQEHEFAVTGLVKDPRSLLQFTVEESLLFLYLYKYEYAVCPAGGNMICGKCRMANVPQSKMCTTVEAVRAHYATGKQSKKSSTQKR